MHYTTLILKYMKKVKIVNFNESEFIGASTFLYPNELVHVLIKQNTESSPSVKLALMNPGRLQCLPVESNSLVSAKLLVYIRIIWCL